MSNEYGFWQKKCLKVRQKLGTRKNLKILKFEKLKIWKFKFKIQNGLSWSLRHAEQFLFSCLCSKVAVYSRKLQWFFWHAPHHHHPPRPCEFRCQRAGSQLKMSWTSDKSWEPEMLWKTFNSNWNGPLDGKLSILNINQIIIGKTIFGVVQLFMSLWDYYILSRAYWYCIYTNIGPFLLFYI